MYYIDNRCGELVKDLDVTYLPPEAYYEYIDNKGEGMVHEVWSDGVHHLDFSWCIVDKFHNKQRDDHFKQHNFKALHLIRYSVPTSWFNETLAEHGL